MTSKLFEQSRLAAVSLGLGIGALAGILAALLTGALLGANAASSKYAPGAGIAFWAAAVMSLGAVVTGVITKMRGGRPGWWATAAILLGAVVLTIVVMTFVFAFAMANTKS